MTALSANVPAGMDAARTAPTLSQNATKVLEARYLKKNEAGECIEAPVELYGRVARTIADVETQYGASERDRDNWEERFYQLVASGDFMPNSPTLMNAGRELGMLSACFVLPVRDSISEIFDAIKHTALIQKSGGGTGFAFDELRPTGDYIRSSGGTTSGPITFWRAFSEATNAIQQGAFRRGANMGMMYIHHPDILKFLHAKQDLNQFTNYNISVKVTDAWMDEFKADPDSPHVVRNPRNGKAFLIPHDLDIWKSDIRDLVEIDCVEPVDPASRETYYCSPKLTASLPDEFQGRFYTKRMIWKIIIDNAWQTGEPGVVFIDRINRENPTPHVGRMEATNPCGEQPLLPYEACNLGSINLGKFVTNANTPQADIDWEALRECIHLSTRFLDNVIDANNYPLPEIDRICKANRKIGLGVMGFADALFMLGVPYNSEKGVEWGERFMKFLNDESHIYSEHLALERGCFANWKGSIWDTKRNRMMRNACTTTVAPTGTISIIANCSGGIEPMFSLAFLRNVLKGQKQGETPLVEVNEIFRKVAGQRGIFSLKLLERLATEGTLAHIPGIPDDLKRVFVCAHDIAPEWHMRMQSAFQKHCDSSISKTINFPESATVEDVEKIYKLAYEMDCKGVTVYRNGCRECQPMALKKKDGAQASRQDGDEATKRRSDEGVVAPARDVARSPDLLTAKPATVENEAVAAATAFEDADKPKVETSQPPEPVRPAPQSKPAGQRAKFDPPRLEPRDLPEIVSGLRIRQMTPFGNMHVKITVDPRSERELEVFAQLGKGGDVANSDLEAVCRIISLWLRAGGSLRHVIKQLEGIGSSLQIPTRTGRITSLGDGLASAMKKYTRAKEVFGLRAMLLGEIDPADLVNPPGTPHTPRTMPVDHPIAVAATHDSSHRGIGNGHGSRGHGNGGNGSGGNGDGSHRSRLVDDARHPSAITDAPNNARSSPANESGIGLSADSGIFSSAGAAGLTTTHKSPTAIVAAPAEVKAATAAVARRATAMAPRYVHNPASHYLLKCPECQSSLIQQEGCQKCTSCGWSAC